MDVGVVGVGVVGSILVRYFSGSRHLKLYDPLKGHVDSLDACGLVFVCVPTPTDSDNSQDTSLVKGACLLAPAGSICVVRSTVLPGTCDYLTRETGRRVIAMPEFITERTSHEDFESQDLIIGTIDPELKVMFKLLFPLKDIQFVTNNEAELTKYAHNCFGATKVAYFNWVHKMCETFGASYDTVRQGVLMSGYINETHTMVPGPDGRLGYGGKCFPKDVKAMIGLSDKLMLDGDILKAVERFNKSVRGYEI